MRARAFNPQVFLELLCYCFFGGLMLHLVSSGKYLSYVTPRMEPYLYFTAAVMLIWACVSLFRLFRPQHRVRSAHCFVLVIPILLLLLPHSPLGTSDFSGNYIGGNNFSGQAGQYGASQKQAGGPAGAPSQEDAAPEDSIDAILPGVPDEDASAGLSGLDEANRKITVSDEDFGLWLSELYVNIEKYEGYTVVMTGFIFKDPGILKEDEFVPARLMMSCCVADLTPVGLLCKYDKASELEKDSWATVEGTLFVGEYEYGGQKYDDPQLRVTKITPAEAVDGYIYPY